MFKTLMLHAAAALVASGCALMPPAPPAALAPPAVAGTVKVQWLGQAAFKITTVEFENGFKLWHMGDTDVFGDMKLIAEMYKPDLVLMPIGGGQFVMNPQHAAMVTKDFIKPKAVIPMHYLTNPGLPGTPADYIKAMGGSPIKVMAINPGDMVEF